MTEWDGNILGLIIVFGLLGLFLSSPFLLILSIVIQNNKVKNPSSKDMEDLIDSINQPLDTPNETNNTDE